MYDTFSGLVKPTEHDYYHWNGQRKATDEFFLSRNINCDFINIGNSKTAAIFKC